MAVRVVHCRHLVRNAYILLYRASSSVVVALASHARGQAFDPPVVHHIFLWHFTCLTYIYKLCIFFVLVVE